MDPGFVIQGNVDLASICSYECYDLVREFEALDVNWPRMG